MIILIKFNIIPFPKYGNIEEPWNYSGIELSIIAAKITNKMILHRI